MNTIKNAYRCLYAIRCRGDYEDGPNGSRIATYGDCKAGIGLVPGTAYIRCTLIAAGKTYLSDIYTGWNGADNWSTAIAEVWLKFCDSHASEF